MMLVVLARVLIAAWVLGAVVITAVRTSHYMYADKMKIKRPIFNIFKELYVVLLWPLAVLSANGRGLIWPLMVKSQLDVESEIISRSQGKTSIKRVPGHVDFDDVIGKGHPLYDILMESIQNGETVVGEIKTTKKKK